MSPDCDAPGADDDASGRRCRSRRPSRSPGARTAPRSCSPPFSGEEQGLLGGKRLLDWARGQGFAVGGMLNNDIVGASTAPRTFGHARLDTARRSRRRAGARACGSTMLVGSVRPVFRRTASGAGAITFRRTRRRAFRPSASASRRRTVLGTSTRRPGSKNGRRVRRLPGSSWISNSLSSRARINAVRRSTGRQGNAPVPSQPRRLRKRRRRARGDGDFRGAGRSGARRLRASPRATRPEAKALEAPRGRPRARELSTDSGHHRRRCPFAVRSVGEERDPLDRGGRQACDQ